MKIALLNPYDGPVAEAESVRRLAIAAHAIGHEAKEFREERELQGYEPDFVLALSHQTAKLTKWPTYAAINCPTSYLNSFPRFLRNMLTYDGLFTVCPANVKWYQDVCSAARKPCHILPFAVTCPTINFDDQIDFSKATAAYFGTNWDGQRLKEVFGQLSRTGNVLFYGPPERWKHVEPSSVRGAVPFDGDSTLRVYRKHGIGLALAQPQFVEEQIPNNRTFEVAAAGALVISSDYGLVREWFGDSILYVDQSKDPDFVTQTIADHITWARENPRAAAAKAQESRAIFEKKFRLEKFMQDAIEFHKDMLLQKRYVIPSIPAADAPRISVIVRAGHSSQIDRRALDSIAGQSYPYITVLLALTRRPSGIEDLIRDYQGKLEIKIVDCPAGSSTLFIGLRKVDTEYFAVLDENDEIYPNHFALLLDAFEKFDAATSRDVKLVYAGSVRQSEAKDLNEHERWRDPNVLGPQYLMVHCFEPMTSHSLAEFMSGQSSLPGNSWLARNDLLDAEILRDPELGSGEDYFLLLKFLERGLFEFIYEITSSFHPPQTGSSDYVRPLDNQQWQKIQNRMGRCPQVTELRSAMLWGLFTPTDPLRAVAQAAEIRSDMTSSFAILASPQPGGAPLPRGASLSREPSVPIKAPIMKRLVWRWRIWLHKLPVHFDPVGYLKFNPDVVQAKIDPVTHFIGFGSKEGRRWNNLPLDFDPALYLQINPDVARAKADPIKHFLEFGAKEGRHWKYNVPPNFDPVAYLQFNPDVARTGADPAKHYVEFGAKEGRRWNNLPSGFDPLVYLLVNPDVLQAKCDPIQHYLGYGSKEGRRWSYNLPAGFDAAVYLQLNPDLARAKLDPLKQYLENGCREGRRWRVDEVKRTREQDAMISWLYQR